MHEFIAKHQQQILGVLSGLDRLVLRGTLRSIAHVEGMKRYLWANQVLLNDAGAQVEQVSQRLKEASVARRGLDRRKVNEQSLIYGTPS